MRKEIAIAGIVWSVILAIILVSFVTGFIPGVCLGMVEYSGEIKGQWIKDDMLYIRFSVDRCSPISICEDTYCSIQGLDSGCEKNEFDTIYFQKEDSRLMFLDDGDNIAVRWCEVPGVGFRIREVKEI
ncbi:MAG: hypothetical protein DRN81_01980 [Thermoproteota archaeon]|nr:MAG: hypothetical protein DRN81_01980 [Candidatus Korarchaeota archaeon]